MGNLIFKRVGEMVGVCKNAEIIEVLQYNVDGNGGFLYIGDGEHIGIESKENLKIMINYKRHFTWDSRSYKIDNLLKD